MNEKDREFIESIAADLASSIRSVARGDEHAPGGLEGIGMALGGEGLSGSVAGGLSEIADAISDHADAVRELAAAVKGE